MDYNLYTFIKDTSDDYIRRWYKADEIPAYLKSMITEAMRDTLLENSKNSVDLLLIDSKDRDKIFGSINEAEFSNDEMDVFIESFLLPLAEINLRVKSMLLSPIDRFRAKKQQLKDDIREKKISKVRIKKLTLSLLKFQKSFKPQGKFQERLHKSVKAASTAAAYAYVGYLAYKKIKDLKCMGTKNKDNAYCKIKAYNAAINKLKEGKSKCSKTNDPKNCRERIDNHVKQWNKKKEITLKKIKKLKREKR